MTSSSTITTETPFTSLELAADEIRLLTILPGAGDNPITCTLSKAALSDNEAPIYETISYAWGDRKDHGTISVNGICLEVPNSALKALKSIRLAREERIAWIDSVCIDQRNVDERNHQVSMMSRIYGRGIGNLIFLGFESGRANDAAIDAFRDVKTIATKARDTVGASGAAMFPYLFNHDKDFWYSEEPLCCDIDTQALAWLYDSQWFSRLWVFQEALLAAKSEAICANVSVDFDDVLTATS